MKVQLPQRMSQRAGWIVVFCLAAPFILLFVSPFAYIGLSLYWKWHQGYGLACESETMSEAYSPSRRWIAKSRIVTCSGLADGQWVEAVLVPNAAVPFLARYKRVFVRDITSGGEALPGGNRLTIRWIDDHSLELQGAHCLPCQSDDHRQPCDSRCGLLNAESGIAISLRPPQN